MARISLTTRARGPGVPFLRADGSGVDAIPVCRLYIRLAVVPRNGADDQWQTDFGGPTTFPAIVDTGAPLTILPHSVWQPFAGDIWFLQQPPPPTGVRRVTVLGGQFPYRLGRIRLGAVDDEGRWLSAVWINAFLLDDHPAAPREPLLGLRSRLLDRRQLRQERSPSDEALPVWWLEDA